MSYSISFKVKVEGKNRYIPIEGYDCEANITWNVREMICKSTSLPWLNEENNGLCVEVIPKIIHGYEELTFHREDYLKYESPNGWGTVDGTAAFFRQIIEDWDRFCKHERLISYPPLVENLIDSVYFWIE